MENCYEKGEIEICDGRLVRIWKNWPLEAVQGSSDRKQMRHSKLVRRHPGAILIIFKFRNRVASKKEDGKESQSVSNQDVSQVFNAIQIFPQTLLLLPTNAVLPNRVSLSKPNEILKPGDTFSGFLGKRFFRNLTQVLHAVGRKY